MVRRAGIVALLALAALLVAGLAGVLDVATFLHGWLFAAHFAIALSLGAAVLLLTYAITGGRWGAALRPTLIGMTAAMPVAVVAWVPLMLGAGGLFPWAGKPIEALPETVVRKLAYLDLEFLEVRTVLVLVAFLGIGWVATWRRLPGGGAAAAALSVFAIAVSIFAVDWLLAFEPEFYSTAYPVLHASGMVVAALAAATLGLRAAHGGRERMEDCGMLLLGWAMVWIYVVFMQYIIIWSGDLPHEIHWFLERTEGGWRLALLFALACNLGATAALCSPRIKAYPDWVAAMALVLLAGQAAHFWWRIAPAFAPVVSAQHLADLGALLALGGLWLIAASIGARWRQREAAHG